MKTLIGIDPGLHGAIVVLKNGRPVCTRDMPTRPSRIGKKTVIDGVALADILREHLDNAVAFLEHIVLRPVGATGGGMGIAAASSFGKGTGIIMGVMDALGLKYYELTPAHWKRAAGLLKQPKKASLAAAKKLWPTWNVRLMKHIDRADAALIAHFGAQIKGEVDGS